MTCCGHRPYMARKNSVNAKSLLGVLTMELVSGAEIRIEAEGPDELEAEETLAKLVG